MSRLSMTTTAEPDGAPRIVVLDILRGIAVLGILFMNINDMGQSFLASSDDVRHLGWSASDQVAWWLREVLANGTARCLLEMLFGAGMVILTDHAAGNADRWTVLRRYYARNLVLFGFGLAHVFILLWPGDILHTYGLAALVAVLFRRSPPHRLLAVGLSLAVMQMVVGSTGYTLGGQDHAAMAKVDAKRRLHQPLTEANRAVLKVRHDRVTTRAKAHAETAAAIAAEDTARRGTFHSWATAQIGAFVDLESRFVEILFVWEAAATMLIGAALFRLGILQGRRSRPWYRATTILAYAIGIVLRAWTAYDETRFDDLPHLSWATSEIGRLAMTLGHVTLVNLLVGGAFGATLLRPFAAAGRTALSVYVAQTLICLWLLYPPFALGLYGTMTWGPLMVTAFVVDAALLLGANLWVRWFDIAPVEWAWRSLVEWRSLTWRRPPMAAASL